MMPVWLSNLARLRLLLEVVPGHQRAAGLRSHRAGHGGRPANQPTSALRGLDFKFRVCYYKCTHVVECVCVCVGGGGGMVVRARW